MSHILKTLLVAITLTATTQGMSYAQTPETATAILAGGCFWCLEHDLAYVDGVLDAVSGYAGGDRPNPTYTNYHHLDETYKTPHIEVVRITYNPTVLSYKKLLDTFLRHIDPTDGNGQFCDRGPAYRPAIFTINGGEIATVNQALTEAETTLQQKLKVDILPAATFWPAEDYHQDYAEKNTAKYKFYRWRCGRDERIDELWNNR